MCVCFIQLNKAVQCWAQHLCIDCSLCCWESNSSSPADDAPCQQTHNNGSSGPPPHTHTHAQWQWMFWEWIAAVTKLVCSMQLSTNNTHTKVSRHKNQISKHPVLYIFLECNREKNLFIQMSSELRGSSFKQRRALLWWL